MITKSKLTFSRYLSISSAMSYCSRSPVPLSPITANRTEFDCSGRCSSSELGAEHDHEIEVDLLAVSLHLLGDVVLFAVAGAAVADHREPDRIRLQRQMQFQRTWRRA